VQNCHDGQKFAGIEISKYGYQNIYVSLVLIYNRNADGLTDESVSLTIKYNKECHRFAGF
jgi:hypothetical protein